MTCNSSQPQVKESVSKFMAYVHMNVNQTSKEYLVNERRYNYTTPKSFLEQIKLYQSLLGQKSKDLTTKTERLENGLQKLNSTSAQVPPISIRFMDDIKRCVSLHLLKNSSISTHQRQGNRTKLHL